MVPIILILSALSAVGASFLTPLNFRRDLNTTLPACSSTPQACICPNGTIFQTSSTYAVLRAKTRDVTGIISNFTNTAWMGTSPVSVGGNSTHPVRSLQGEVDGAVIVTQEILTEYVDYSGGAYLENKRPREGFFERFELIGTPITYVGDNGPGLLAGAWDTIDVRKISEGETLWIWGIYACMSAALNFGQIHRFAINNTSSVLEEAGKLRGETIGPFSI
ncbi:hypothetical protein F5B21DRAFT_509550 [Xylaria acuta]|nr:hypothetical protein F5B21DRAFT_509550 [Xylaria acuta]